MSHTLLPSSRADNPPHFPGADELAGLRAWYAGLPVREAVRRYLLKFVTDANDAHESTIQFAGAGSGSECAAAICSLVGTAKLSGIDPEAYPR
ncbi:hypothetical protein BN2475_1690005 [Paraburkholderia ribeironis]|uniref:Uncharacterized protein n=1 Tax=Paraburkholderia ribeironis TaxID=1247936 RepID=A0A1N7SQH1_9BURK|nr:hypothetical protein BN2475_1690005 [Paraburkholderia ribeironis]